MWCAGPQVEEIHTTLRKHLRKEEEQLLPLLVAHFSTAEQAELVAQFLCSLPLSTVEVGVVLAGVERHRAGGTIGAVHAGCADRVGRVGGSVGRGVGRLAAGCGMEAGARVA